ncbi:MAG TPA: hypothetical protein VFU78_07810 [Thermomicrobiales bacterium]|nr:hypothetical protein [Thermomicrobiales bacterium]
MMYPIDLDRLYELRQAEIERDLRQRELLHQARSSAKHSLRARLAVRLIALACWLAPAMREQVIVQPVSV